MPTKTNWNKKIWDELSDTDVTEYAQRKGTTGFNPLYIPWSVVHYILSSKEMTCEFTRTDHPLEVLPDGTGIVSVTIEIKGRTKTAMLAVMNHKFQAVKCDARSVQDAYQRAFVKAAGLWGLGISLWVTGDGEPVDLEPISAEEVTEELLALIKQVEADNITEVSADMLASARALAEEGTNTTRMASAISYIKKQL